MSEQSSFEKRWGKRIISETRLRRYELRVERAIRKALNKHRDLALDAVRTQAVTASAPPDSFGMYSWDTDVDDMVLPELGDVLGDIATGVGNFLSLDPDLRAQVLGEIDVATRAANFADKVRSVSEEIAPRLMDELSIGISKGEGMDKLAKRIDGVFQIGNNAAQRIARTETHGAVQNTQHATASAVNRAGVEMTKEWLSTSDKRTRKTHVDADEQIVGIDLPFTLAEGAHSLMFPGDNSLGAPAKEIVNCRCDTIYDVA